MNISNIREILAKNLKENRKRLGITQPQLAEKAGLSTHYLAMIEVARKFPTAEMLERLAKALNIETYELFNVKASPEDSMEMLHNTLVNNIERLVSDAVDKAINNKLMK